LLFLSFPIRLDLLLKLCKLLGPMNLLPFLFHLFLLFVDYWLLNSFQLIDDIFVLYQLSYYDKSQNDKHNDQSNYKVSFVLFKGKRLLVRDCDVQFSCVFANWSRLVIFCCSCYRWTIGKDFYVGIDTILWLALNELFFTCHFDNTHVCRLNQQDCTLILRLIDHLHGKQTISCEMIRMSLDLLFY